MTELVVVFFRLVLVFKRVDGNGRPVGIEKLIDFVQFDLVLVTGFAEFDCVLVVLLRRYKGKYGITLWYL